MISVLDQNENNKTRRKSVNCYAREREGNQTMKIFISHSEKDRKITDEFVELLFAIGLRKEDIFYSSYPELGVPNNEDIYDYLRTVLDTELYALLMLSDNYYASPACLNEMGAVWMKKTKYMPFLLPGFKFEEIKGAINPRRAAIKLDCEEDIVKERLNMFKDELSDIFATSISSIRWEKKRDAFLDFMLPNSQIEMSNAAPYCIGANLTDGCVITKNTENEFRAEIDFSKTTSDLCSVVIFPGDGNWSKWYRGDKMLCFEASATNVIRDIFVELKFAKRNLKYKISIGDSLKTFTIPLNAICKNEEYWTEVREICFLVSKGDIDTFSTLCVKNLRIV